MVSDVQQVAAVWAVLVVPFVLVAAFLWSRGELGAGFVAAYWFPPLVLVLIGVLPAPWELVSG